MTPPLYKKKDRTTDEEVEELHIVIDECVAFLSYWKVYVGQRSEAAEDAFVAISELENAARRRLDYLNVIDEQEELPF